MEFTVRDFATIGCLLSFALENMEALTDRCDKANQRLGINLPPISKEELLVLNKKLMEFCHND